MERGMKIFILTTLLFLPLLACCSTTPKLILRFEDRPYRPCTENEVKKFSQKNDDRILFCFRYCVKYKLWRKHIPKNCKQWKTDVLDKQSDVRKLRSRNFDW